MAKAPKKVPATDAPCDDVGGWFAEPRKKSRKG